MQTLNFAATAVDNYRQRVDLGLLLRLLQPTMLVPQSFQRQCLLPLLLPIQWVHDWLFRAALGLVNIAHWSTVTVPDHRTRSIAMYCL